MRTLFLTFIISTGIYCNIGNESINAIEENKTPIPMKGKIELGENKLTTSHDPFTVVWSDAHELSILSSSNVPDLTLTVLEEEEIVLEFTFSLEEKEQRTFSLLGCEEGRYTVLITMPNRFYLNGEYILIE